MSKQLIISGQPIWDDDKEEFTEAKKDYILHIEHSLLSIAKWEAIYNMPFLSSKKNLEMIKTYAKCMSLNKIPDEAYDRLSVQNLDDISSYIEEKHSATYFGSDKLPHKNGKMMGEVITAEIVYYWMISMNIPVEFEKWHLNRLLTLIRVISEKNDPKGGKKMTISERKALNAARKAKYHTRG